MDFDMDLETCNQTLFEFYSFYIKESKDLIKKYLADLNREIIDYFHYNAQHLALALLFYILLSICFYYCLLKNKLMRELGEIKNCKNILFVTSHPDDECMFFGPSIVSLTRKPGANVYLLCLSRGNHQNLGRIRKEELFSSCKILGIPESNVQLINSSLLPDNPKVNWNEEVVAQIILHSIEVYSIDTVITFDKHGVSNHPNHSSLFYAVAFLCLEKQLPKYCTAYALESVSKLRKYFAFLDLPLSFLMSSKKYVVPMEMRELIQKAMKEHKSQYKPPDFFFLASYIEAQKTIFTLKDKGLRVADRSSSIRAQWMEEAAAFLKNGRPSEEDKAIPEMLKLAEEEIQEKPALAFSKILAETNIGRGRGNVTVAGTACQIERKIWPL